MTFSQRKRTLLQGRQSRACSTFFIALGVAMCFFVPYIITGRGYFIFYGDFNVQQIPFYQTCHAAVRAGNMGWSWLTDLGANFVGSYSFYLLGSPFFWLTIPFPNWFVPYLMGPLLILKFGCAALTGYLYLRRFTRTADAARIGGLLYAFSGFSVYNIFFNHFHEPLIFFPLLLLGLELLMTERRHGVFALTVALCAMVNYFFFFGMVVFCVLYFFTRALSGAVKVSFKRFLLMLLEAVLGLCMAAVLLIPSILAVSGNSRLTDIQTGWNALMYGKEQIYLNVIQCFFFPPDLPARPVFFPGAEVRWSSLGGWLPVFGMVGVFAWFQNRKGHWLKRLIAICALMALVPVLNSLFYALNSAYYARWFYMAILMMCLATVWMIEDESVNWVSAWKWVFGITLSFALVIGLFPQKAADGTYILGVYMQEAKEKVTYLLPRLGIALEQTFFFRYWITVLIAILGLLILRWILRWKKTDRQLFYRLSVVAICVFSVIYANFFISWGREHSEPIKKVMIDRMIEGSVDLPAGDGYRIDVYDGVDNTGMFLGIPSINAFHSVVPSSIMDFYTYIGQQRDVASRPTVEDAALRSLLSVKYLLNAPSENDNDFTVDHSTGETRMPGYRYIKTENGFNIYENENYIPYGFSYDYYMTKEFCDNLPSEDRAAWMTKAILLDRDQIIEYGGTMRNIDSLYDILTDEEDPFATGLEIGDDALAVDSANRRATAATEFSVGKSTFSAMVSRESPALVFFSVPYDDGWCATVNGKKATVERVNGGFMAVKVLPGQSRIVFTYKTPGLALGFAVSMMALGLFLLYLLLALVLSRKYPSDPTYPEGDELLLRWHHDILFDPADSSAQPDSILTDLPDFPLSDGNFDGGFVIDPDANFPEDDA